MALQSSPGRIGLVHIHGGVGLGIRFGQWLNGSGFEDFEHAFLDLGDGTLIQAEPGGAQIRPLSIYAGEHVYWCDNIYHAIPGYLRQDIADAAREFQGVKYSFLDYDALVLHRLGLNTKALQRRISGTGHLICSQLVDASYIAGGFRIFSDGRWDGFVTPGDLYMKDMSLAGQDTIVWDGPRREWRFGEV